MNQPKQHLRLWWVFFRTHDKYQPLAKYFWRPLIRWHSQPNIFGDPWFLDPSSQIFLATHDPLTHPAKSIWLFSTSPTYDFCYILFIHIFSRQGTPCGRVDHASPQFHWDSFSPAVAPTTATGSRYRKGDGAARLRAELLSAGGFKHMNPVYTNLTTYCNLNHCFQSRSVLHFQRSFRAGMSCKVLVKLIGFEGRSPLWNKPTLDVHKEIQYFLTWSWSFKKIMQCPPLPALRTELLCDLWSQGSRQRADCHARVDSPTGQWSLGPRSPVPTLLEVVLAMCTGKAYGKAQLITVEHPLSTFLLNCNYCTTLLMRVEVIVAVNQSQEFLWASKPESKANLN